MAEGDGASPGLLKGSWEGRGRYTHSPSLSGKRGGVGTAPIHRPTSSRMSQVVNEVPQPQEDFAFGLSNLKPAPVTDVT